MIFWMQMELEKKIKSTHIIEVNSFQFTSTAIGSCMNERASRWSVAGHQQLSAPFGHNLHFRAARSLISMEMIKKRELD